MAGLIPQSFIDDLLNRVDIVDVIGSRITLKKSGKNHSARCPFHEEKTPSFTVSAPKQFYYCFGCGAGGNAISFLMDHEHLDFPQAVETLARHAGLEVPKESTSTPERSTQATHAPLYETLSAANHFFRHALRHDPHRQAAVRYLKGRGLSGEIARDYGLGLAPPGWDNLIRHMGEDPAQLKRLLDSGLVIENEESGRYYDRFRDRITFPIRDNRGRVIAFGGRVLGDDKPKYLNSPETPVFHKGQELYGLFEARQHNRQLEEILIVEGYMDVIALAQLGIRNAVATLGTATSELHVRKLLRLVHNLTFCFDGDAAGRRAAWRALESTLPTLEDGCKVRFLFLPEGEDPDSVVRHEGAEAFRERIRQQAQPLAEYLFQHLKQEASPETLEGKAHLATLATPLIRRIPGTNLRTLMLQQLKRETDLEIPDAPAPAVTATESPPIEPRPASPMEQPRRSRPPFRAPSPAQNLKAVESLTLLALRILLHHPSLAHKVESAAKLADERDPYSQLLIALIDSLQKHPDQQTLQLLARWHGTEQGHLLRRLTEKEWLISADNLEQQFFDAIKKLTASQNERRLDQLLTEARKRELSDEEKTRLRQLLHPVSGTGSSSQSGER